jgi:hypothetical protein
MTTALATNYTLCLECYGSGEVLLSGNPMGDGCDYVTVECFRCDGNGEVGARVYPCCVHCASSDPSDPPRPPHVIPCPDGCDD